ncbi:ATP-binding protein [Paralimibaculum aggregatum]|uniref:ATP-binding protein n=1 Tax=Paralimibaculum aggregatum TaxID=3036245 RepID=A0ABQ6LGY6_9RHOB|nr:ATP-binding protein [Limibaculum sp. NKW23]GMG82563.1 ATP-binding protein [Limibaculum sp. NKW23]
MEHFAVVQSIIKAALTGDEAAVRKQVSRLEARLRKSGANKEVATLERLLNASSEAKDLVPSQVEISRALITGETLTPEVHPPIDRETGAMLCLIDFPNGETPKPVYGRAAQETIEGLLGEWRNGGALQAIGVEPTRSLLVYGPPGTGKTLTAHYIAEQLGLPMVTARIDGLISSFLGTTARNIANLFDFANRYACVLLLDEFDALAKLRDDPHEIGEIKRVVNTLLQNLDRRRAFGITIAITNHDGLLDPAVWRRFETQLFIGEPENVAREALIIRFLEPIIVDKATVRVFSYCLPGRSGADLERICRSVKRSVVMASEEPDASALFKALSQVLGRMPKLDHAPARILAEDHQAFVSLIANDPDIGLDQTEIGRATGTTQSRVSTLKKERRHVDLMERINAQ